MIFSRSHSLVALSVGCLLAAGGCRSARPTPGPPVVVRRDAPAIVVVPAPVSLTVTRGEPFVITAATTVVVDPGNAEAARTGEMLAALLRPSTGFPIAVAAGSPAVGAAVIALRLDDRAARGAEGYELTVTRDSVRIVASQPAGLFRGLQTLRQLLPPSIESHMKLSGVAWAIPSVTIADHPRFAWRGAMLDVSRHFFSTREVKQYIDLLALYKLNVLHLHLSDDQGWRIEIKSRPRLANVGGATQVGGGPGGFYTQAEYADIVRYAQERYITIVPEIDMPGHTNAALVAYPDLSCSKRPTELYTGTDVGWSALCVDNEGTYALVDDIVREIAALTPGRYFHIGGDEVEVLTGEQYARFVERVQDIVARHGKEMVGWEEISKARLRSTTLVQQWRTDSAGPAVQQGAKVILSHGKKMYLDMKYTPATELGLSWAGHIEMRDVYDWDPGTYLVGATERDVAGVEAPIWSETVRNITAVQYLVMPRLPAVAEVAWTPQARRDWGEFRVRLAAHAPRWNFLGVNFHRSPQIPWP